MLTLGIDLGSSSIKAAIFDVEKKEIIASEFYPEQEMEIISTKAGFAEQDPNKWYEYFKILVKKILSKNDIDGKNIKAIGISYQMHGLVIVNKDLSVIRPSIIWCDSRAVEIGNKAFNEIGNEKCLSTTLNSPANFTASKLRWVKLNEPEKFNSIYKFMLPGDFLAMKLTGEINTTISGLSEGIFWNFKENSISKDVIDYYEIPLNYFPEIKPTFSNQGKIQSKIAEELGISKEAIVSYRAGDQPNNALSLNVLNAGEVAATAGTSGVIYAVINQKNYDSKNRINIFAHVNHSNENIKLGVLLCINGTGILNSWIRKSFASNLSYNEMNELAIQAPIGSDDLFILPFGNGAERMLENKLINASIHGLDFNRHTIKNIIRAAHEGVAFSFKYGFDIIQELGIKIEKIKAGKANMFLSKIFRETLANTTGATIEMYDTDGAHGAARGAAYGAGLYNNIEEAFTNLKKLEVISPDDKNYKYIEAYNKWFEILNNQLNRG
ncbi:MAG: FGGY family carbohydrate kinase [Melioribacteraceae bacterium]|nr:FGGY family carbohydrate kinase [Melioribacteraceae bacterium]